MLTRDYIESVKPSASRGQSDKYSLRFYQWLKKHPNFNRVVFRRFSTVTGEQIAFDPTQNQAGQIYIAHVDAEGFGGASLMAITCNTGDVYYHPCGPHAYDDITDWFWREYKARGRCVMDPEHRDFITNTDDRYVHVKSTRRCTWCGEWHHGEVVKLVTVKRRTLWTPVRPIPNLAGGLRHV